MSRTAVVGHVEWVDFAVVARYPAPGAITTADAWFAEPGGGGAVAAVQLSRMAGAPMPFFTSVGADALGTAARDRLAELGVDVHAAVHDLPQRRAFTHLDGEHERTITVMGERHVPHGDDDLPWELLDGCDAVYLSGGDAAAVRHARRARVVVATPRVGPALAASGIEADVVVASAADAGERIEDLGLRRPPRLVVLTEGARGGRWRRADGTEGRWEPAPVPGEPVDAYGCGDTFAAALAHALGARLPLPDALAYAARCGAACLTGRGPYAAPLPPLG